MALPQEAVEILRPDPDSVVHRLASVYIPPDAAVGIFRALHFPTTPWHLHDFYELAIIESGTAHHVSERGIEPVRRGTVLFLPPGVGHEYRLCSDVLVYNCLFRAELADAELMWAFRDGQLGVLFDPGHGNRARPGGSIVRVELSDAEVDRVIDTLEPIRTGSPDARTRAGQLGHLLLALDIVASVGRAAERPTEQWQAMPTPVARAVALIDRDIAHAWTLTELSRMTYVGPAHLARSFAKWIGLPPMHYLNRLRAERAAAMLARSDEAIAS